MKRLRVVHYDRTGINYAKSAYAVCVFPELEARKKEFSASWIFLPSSVEFAVSEDGKEFIIIATFANDISPLDPEPRVKEFSANPAGKNARFVRVHARNIGVCPDGHPGAGNKAWLFADEIIIE